MDTTQKNRDAALPESAQQRNGAKRSAEEQRGAAGRPAAPAKKPPAPKPEQKQTAQRRKTARQSEKTSAQGEKRKVASAAGTAVKRRPTAKQETPDRKKKSAPAKKRPEEKKPAVQGLPDSVSTKKRAYGNSKPKKKSALEVVNEAARKRAQKKAAQSMNKKKTVKSHQQDAPAVIYTQPQAFNRNRLLVQLVTVLAVVAALVMGLSVFFKVETITVTGADVYSAWAVREASGITEGDNLLTFSHARAGAQIKANLPYVDTVRFGIKLPDTVNIIIEEADVVYAIKDQDGTWWLMNSSGRMVEQTNSGVAANYTQILGVTVESPAPNEKAVATESAAVMETDPVTGETAVIPVAVTGAQRLQAALYIVQALEANDIVGDAASVDVSRLEDIILWYGTRYQVNLGNSGNLDHKIDCMNDVILQMSEYQSGILDVSFTIWPNQVGYTPFS